MLFYYIKYYNGNVWVLFGAYLILTMIDLHCHILPGLDDGAGSLDTSCRMAAMAADSGVRTIVATPHCNTRNERKNYRSAALSEAFRDLQEELDRWEIPVRILPGAEVLVRGDFVRLLEEGRFLTLNRSRYLLVEFYFDENPGAMNMALRQVEAAGLVPVIAHPERYYAVQENPSLAEAWADRGWVLQINKGSILGDLGEGSYDAAALLLRRGAVGVLASDAHHFRQRSPHMGPLVEALEYRFPEIDPRLLLEENPRRIINNRTLALF